MKLLKDAIARTLSRLREGTGKYTSMIQKIEVQFKEE